jgi:hypothetical protein
VFEKVRRYGQLSLDIAWAGVILLLPVTSLPLLSALAGESMVAPASFIPLIWLIVFWFILYIIKKGTLPREAVPFLLFISVAIVASASAFFIRIPAFKTDSIPLSETKAVATLLVGSLFYLVTAGWLLKPTGRLNLTLKLINIGGAIMLTWSIAQGVFIFFYGAKFPAPMLHFQSLISVSGFYPTRMTGFAFEPSWLGQQLNLLYLPYWLAATLTGTSAFSFRIWKFRLENFLLVIGAVIQFLSSRIGTLSFLFILAFFVIYIGWLLVKRVRKWSTVRSPDPSKFIYRLFNALVPAGILLAILGVFFLAAVALVFAISQVDPRLARLFQISSVSQVKELTANIYVLFSYLAFAERYVFWVAGWTVFNLHPILGVGLGNAGFFFTNALPAYSWHLPEVVNLLFRAAVLPNIKSLWVRLLAETGIVGFSAFIAWCYTLVRSGWRLRHDPRPVFKMIGWFGIFVLIDLIFEGFSTDTFALPYLWVSLGILCAAAASARAGEA